MSTLSEHDFRPEAYNLDRRALPACCPARKKMRTFLGSLLLAAALAGCAGTPFRFDDARKVKVGMTEKELTALMGSPYMVTTKGDEQIWVWSAATAFGTSKFVSFPLRDGKVSAVPYLPESFR